MATTRYGLPYKGSKNKIARWVAECLPPADNFYDLFCGGCSITHVMLAQNKYRGSYIANDIKGELPLLFSDAAHGRLNIDYRWISRKEFDELKDVDPIVALCYSFGFDKHKGYLYGQANEEFKHAYHQAVVDCNVEPIKGWGYDLSPILRYKDIETRYMKAKPIIKSRVKRSDLITIENAPRLQSVERLQHLEELQNLETLESLERLESRSADFQDIDILPNSTVYCDIPYVGTTGYDGVFNHADFYEWALSREFPVFVSEYWMPDDFAPIAIKGKYVTLSAHNNSTVKAETIFVQRRYARQYVRDLFL